MRAASNFGRNAAVIAVFVALSCGVAQAVPVVNAANNGASYAPPQAPGSGLAQGGFFSIFGEEMAGAEGVINTTLPLPTELGGARVTVTSGETSYDAYLTFVRADQINAILPSDVPVGPAEIRVEFNGETSEPITVEVVAHAFGIFTATSRGAGPGSVTNFVSQTSQPINSSSTPIEPSGVVTIWGTGLIGTPGADDVAPLESGVLGDRQGEVQVEVLVGSKPVSQILYAGRSAEFPGIDQISVELAADTPGGCFVPLLVFLNGVPSNEVTIAVGPADQQCSDPLNPLSSALVNGGGAGVLANVRLLGNVALSQALALDFSLDVFAGSFSQQSGAPFSYNRFFSLPPMGTCSRQDFRGIDLVGLLGGSFPDLDFGPELDAGANMTIMRDLQDERVVPQDAESVGRYVDTVGGGLALIGEPDPLYYEPGEYSITSEGGSQVGAVDVSFTLPERPMWLDRGAFTAETVVDRSQSLNISWEAGDEQAPQIMLVVAANVHLQTGIASGFLCLVPQSSGGLDVSPHYLSTVSASEAPGQGGPTTLGFIGLGSLPVIQSYEAEGLDLGVALGATLELQSVMFQ